MTNDQAMFDSYISGLSSEEVALQFGVSSQTVRTAVKKIDPTKIRKPGRLKKTTTFAPQPITQNDWDELESATQGDALSVTPTPAE